MKFRKVVNPYARYILPTILWANVQGRHLSVSWWKWTYQVEF